MRAFYEKLSPDQLPPEELSDRERALLQAQQNQERIQRWRNLAGPEPKGLQSRFRSKKWIWLAALLLILALLCWKSGWFSATSIKETQTLMAARTDLLDYPFDNITVRGSRDIQNRIIPAQALEAYRIKDFETALRSAGEANHFFNALCWLQLKKPEKALEEFDKMPPNDRGVGDEFFYYKGVALQDLGRQEEAQKAFQQIMESRTVRELFRTEAAKRLGEGR